MDEHEKNLHLRIDPMGRTVSFDLSVVFKNFGFGMKDRLAF